MTNTFIPHFSCRITPSVLNHRDYTTSSAAARNLYDSLARINMGEGNENIDDRKWQIFFRNTLMPVILKYATPAGK